MYVFLQLVVSLYLALVVAGLILYWYFEEELGWKYFTLQMQWTLFGVLILGVAAVVGGLAFAVYLLVRRFWFGRTYPPGFQSSKSD